MVRARVKDKNKWSGGNWNDNSLGTVLLCKHETPLNLLPTIHTEVCNMVRNPVQEVADTMCEGGRDRVLPGFFLARLLILIGEAQVSARGPVSETR